MSKLLSRQEFSYESGPLLDLSYGGHTMTPPSYRQSSRRTSWHSRQRLTRESLPHKPGEEVRKGSYVLSDARFFEGIHVGVAVTDGYDCPGVSARCHHCVHQITPDATIPVHIRMDIDEHKMPEHHAHGWVGLFAQEIEKCWHGVPHC